MTHRKILLRFPSWWGATAVELMCAELRRIASPCLNVSLGEYSSYDRWPHLEVWNKVCGGVYNLTSWLSGAGRYEAAQKM